jgi:hypothetical protein
VFHFVGFLGYRHPDLGFVCAPDRGSDAIDTVLRKVWAVVQGQMFRYLKGYGFEEITLSVNLREIV